MEDINNIIKNIEKDFKCFVGKGSDDRAVLEKIKTGIDAFDRIIGGGLIRGRLHIFTGPFASGKTFLGQTAMAACQNQGGVAAYIDSERRYDPEWFDKTGVNIGDLILARPKFGEEAGDVILALVQQGVDLILVDSLAALVPLSEYEGEMGDQFIGLQARMLNKLWRKLTPINEKTVILATNQMRQNIGDRFHPGIQETMIGGLGQNYFASLVVRVSRSGSIIRKEEKNGAEKIITESTNADKRREGQKIGFMINCFTTKCNFAPPFQEIEIPFNFVTGQLDHLASLIDVAIDLGIIKQKAAWYSVPVPDDNEFKQVQGKAGIDQLLTDNPNVHEYIKNLVKNA